MYKIKKYVKNYRIVEPTFLGKCITCEKEVFYNEPHTIVEDIRNGIEKIACDNCVI